MSQSMMALLLSAGGGVGAVCRYLVGLFFMSKVPNPSIPIAMLIVNLVGSLGLGLLYGGMYDEPEVLYGNTIFLALGLGFLGAFTTFSTFSVEAIQLLTEKLYKKAGIYVSLSIGGSIVGFIIGFFSLNT
ncbi:fluoride efflux transporter CrcB [Sutcliffiella horikoshii]|uniref:fluoride efflux transporter CrcB n=1 Tax=Sutcliffiella horikoshii TaxID=79883 RepID=UPI001EEDBC60|nr:fluoride efflux transporter CrcB [Sutcliffiella horikoshii]